MEVMRAVLGVMAGHWAVIRCVCCRDGGMIGAGMGCGRAPEAALLDRRPQLLAHAETPTRSAARAGYATRPPSGAARSHDLWCGRGAVLGWAPPPTTRRRDVSTGTARHTAAPGTTKQHTGRHTATRRAPHNNTQGATQHRAPHSNTQGATQQHEGRHTANGMQHDNTRDATQYTTICAERA